VDSAAPRDYAVYGLRVRSGLDLTGWPILESGPEPDLTILLEPLTTPLLEGLPHSARSLIEDGELKLGVLGVARYRATGGTTIRVDPAPGAKVEDVQLYLTGAVMGAIMHQRGAFPLHAGCVAIAGQAIALAGPSGSGKSTLVAALVRGGAGFVSDDVCALARLPGGTFGVCQSARRTKLDLAAISAVGSSEPDLEPAGGTRGKFLLPVKEVPDGMSPVPLGRVYLLRDGEGPPRTERLEGLEAVSALVEETYYLAWAVGLGLAKQCFRRAGELARKVQVIRLVRPRGFEHLQDLVDLIRAEPGHP
jgi:hypothetical protein